MTLYGQIGHLINFHLLLLLLYVFEIGSLHLFENYPSVNYITYEFKTSERCRNSSKSQNLKTNEVTFMLIY